MEQHQYKEGPGKIDGEQWRKMEWYKFAEGRGHIVG